MQNTLPSGCMNIHLHALWLAQPSEAAAKSACQALGADLSPQRPDSPLQDAVSFSRACDPCMADWEPFKLSGGTFGAGQVGLRQHELATHAQLLVLDGIEDEAPHEGCQGRDEVHSSECEAGDLLDNFQWLRDAATSHIQLSEPLKQPEPSQRPPPESLAGPVQDNVQVLYCSGVRAENVQTMCSSKALVIQDQQATDRTGARTAVSGTCGTIQAQNRACVMNREQGYQEKQNDDGAAVVKTRSVVGGCASETPCCNGRDEPTQEQTRPPPAAWDIPVISPGVAAPILLGESGTAYSAVQAAVRSIVDVHESDGLMHFEFVGPFWELTEVCTPTILHGTLQSFALKNSFWCFGLLLPVRVCDRLS